MRLGDLDALLEKMKRRKDYVGRPSDPVCLVEDAPTVDAVPVVRCKDCKFIEHAIDCKGKHCYCCYNSDSPVDNDCPIDADWFCADGERKENDAKAST